MAATTMYVRKAPTDSPAAGWYADRIAGNSPQNPASPGRPNEAKAQKPKHVVVHPQSIVHSMVELTDGATVAQLSLPDMRLPIGYALAHPRRLAVAFGAIDWTPMRPLHFALPPRPPFPSPHLASHTPRHGTT